MVPGEKEPEDRWKSYKNPYLKEDLYEDDKGSKK